MASAPPWQVPAQNICSVRVDVSVVQRLRSTEQVRRRQGSSRVFLLVVRRGHLPLLMKILDEESSSSCWWLDLETNIPSNFLFLASGPVVGDPEIARRAIKTTLKQFIFLIS